MRCAFAALAIGLLVAGCDEEQQVEQQAKNGPSLEEHYQKQLKSELDKIQEEADRRMQKNMKIMSDVNQANRGIQDDIRLRQQAVDSALKTGRSDNGKEKPELPSLRSSRDNNNWRSGN
jgi:outer membrane murein-binding lipoprotein Lpp